jgi:hypothetical protein
MTSLREKNEALGNGLTDPIVKAVLKISKIIKKETTYISTKKTECQTMCFGRECSPSSTECKYFRYLAEDCLNRVGCSVHFNLI